MNKIYNFNYLLLFVSILILPVQLSAQENYDISSGGQGKNGQYFVKVTTHVKDLKEAKEELKKDAVRGILFRGFISNETGIESQKPLIRDPSIETTKADFFNSFFSENKYARYVTLTETSFNSVKESRKSYMVSALLLVDKEQLIHYLEEAGIIKGFSNLW
jgi:hypothetical protein